MLVEGEGAFSAPDNEVTVSVTDVSTSDSFFLKE